MSWNGWFRSSASPRRRPCTWAHSWRSMATSTHCEHYAQLHKKINHAWDLVVMQAREQLRAAKQRRKGDRLVISCQEQTYWLVNRPPPGALNILEQGPERGSYNSSRVQMSSDFYKCEIKRFRKALGRNRVKSSVCLEAYLKFSSQHGPHDPILSGCLPSNPWITDDVTYWAINAPKVAAPTKLRVERWSFSFRELLDDPVGRGHFMDFLQKEFSAENLSFWEACEELRFGGQAQVPALVDAVYQQFLAPGAARWVNIDSRTMEWTLEGMRQPHRYVLDAAQLHIYMLMKKDSYPRFLKSDIYKGLLEEAVIPLETKRRTFLSSGHSHSCGNLCTQAPALFFNLPLRSLRRPAPLQVATGSSNWILPVTSLYHHLPDTLWGHPLLDTGPLALVSPCIESPAWL
ncbi:regulator of G-protein signaling 11 isoform X2 [Chionomys nivalis]|uniref:regulator of G-protein signaling 11 isoform X2 n=1 Tax=Chionomys nivalis TaxID=269649 RepID=UPI00259AB4EC|nr:regulator of G-protein signaling 11 isoform X2 [Chionomys nivalis]XP_057632410.1 regulator of G-protein signaling 11 isoform X2 [Chionomys nivalis]